MEQRGRCDESMAALKFLAFFLVICSRLASSDNKAKCLLCTEGEEALDGSGEGREFGELGVEPRVLQGLFNAQTCELIPI